MHDLQRALNNPIKGNIEHFITNEKPGNPKTVQTNNTYRTSFNHPIRRKSDRLTISTEKAVKVSEKHIPVKSRFGSSKVLQTEPAVKPEKKSEKPSNKHPAKRSKTLKPDQRTTSLYKSSAKTDQNEKFRDYMEDITLVQNNFNNDTNKNLYCIIDGHGGDQTAKMSYKRFPLILKKYVDEFPFEIEKALKKAFHSLDKEVEVLKLGNVGNTLTCVFILGGILYCANVGDSSCVLVHNKAAEMISVDHKCTNADEIKRIQKAGGTIDEDRLNGILAVSRCIGDFDLKNQGLTSEPYIYKKHIEKNDKYLVLASDGVWDVLKPKDIKEICEENIDPELISEEIILEAKEFGSEDNISVIVVELNKGMKIYKKSHEI